MRRDCNSFAMLFFNRSTLFAGLCSVFLTVLSTMIRADGLDQDIAMVASTSFGEELPFAAVEGRTWRAEKGARFVKLHMYLNNPVSLSGISVRACDPLEGGIRAFINFDESVVDLPANGSTAEISFNARVARSVTLNFQNTRDLCLERILKCRHR